MREALRDSPDQKRPVPAGIVSVKIDPDTGLLARPGQRDAIFEYFMKENAPRRSSGGSGAGADPQGTDEMVRDIF